MGQEQQKIARPNISNGKQIKSCNQLDDHSPNNRGLSPTKNQKPQSSNNLSIGDLQQNMNLENYELIEIMEYLKKNKYFLDQTILGKGGNGYVLKGIDTQNNKVAVKVLKCETEDQYLQNKAEYDNLNISKGSASLSQPEKQYIIPHNGALFKQLEQYFKTNQNQKEINVVFKRKIQQKNKNF